MRENQPLLFMAKFVINGGKTGNGSIVGAEEFRGGYFVRLLMVRGKVVLRIVGGLKRSFVFWKF